MAKRLSYDRKKSETKTHEKVTAEILEEIRKEVNELLSKCLHSPVSRK